MAFIPLTAGSIERMLKETETGNPVLQIIKQNDRPDHYRLMLSDGKVLHGFAMVASSQISDKLSNFCILRVLQHTISVMKPKESITNRILVLLDVEILFEGPEVGQQIGKPVSLLNKECNRDATPKKTPPKGNWRTENKPKETKSETSPLCQISSLNQCKTKWTIKARVTNKSGIQYYNNDKGQLFTMDLIDESGEIQATVFQDKAVKYHDMIQVHKVYFISNCLLKPANKRFYHLKHDFEMTFTPDTIVQECKEKVDNIPMVQYNLVPISSIENMDANSTADVAEICLEIGETQTVTNRTTGKEGRIRNVVLADQSLSKTSLTLRGDDTVKCDIEVHSVLIIKRAKITDFKGKKYLNVYNSGSIQINPDIPEAHKLRTWFNNGGENQIKN